MKKPKLVVALFSAVISLTVTAIVLCFSVSMALYDKRVSGNGTYGEVSLRSYYETGTGTRDDPYVITRPRHLYNLSRLQGLGIYGEQKYFQLGKVDLGGVNSNGVPMCYADDYSNEKLPYLDMSTSNQTNNTINAIGSEALPFYGNFDGQNVEIKNLNVYANPQDAGLFGYTAHGSYVGNIFLSNIQIHALGYTAGYADLYAPESIIGNDAYFTYNSHKSGEPTVTFDKSYENTEYSYFYANNLEDFEYTEVGSSPLPTVTITAPSSPIYTFSSLFSGDLITLNNNNEIVPDLNRVFSFIKEAKDKTDPVPPTYPIQASSAVSLVVSSVDSYGQKHSKVLLTLEYDFTLSEGVNFISMGVRIGSDHGNNIGLVAGHCDGTIENCYVYNGAFHMNDGGQGYYSLNNRSEIGLVGHIGGTVQNILAKESDVGAKDGKNIGVLDFTTIYKDIVNDDSFTNSHRITALSDGVNYDPIPTSKYIQYLRDYDGTYVTKKADSVSFMGRTIITNTDLGVFTIATESGYFATGAQSDMLLENSMILTDDNLAIEDEQHNKDYYVYYATGEYVKSYHTKYGTGVTYDNYMNSYFDHSSTTLLPGYHFPSKEQFSKESFETRESRQNYFIRFKLDPSYRNGKGFYFSDLDVDYDDEGKDGNAFMANYFSYKLVDQNNQNIAIGDNKCGIMLKNNLRQEIGSFSASFACPNLTPTYSPTPAYCLEDSKKNPYVSNMVNFEIVNERANVTIIAAPSESGKPSAIGIYKLDDGDFSGKIDYEQNDYKLQFNQAYNQPDYAFFMPTDDNLAYFDYRVQTQNRKGEIGVYDSEGEFTVATNETNATVPAEYHDPESNYKEYGYQPGKTRLFAHTFCLPNGRYCVGSAAKSDQCVPNIYYICAQGQDNGQFDFDDNVFATEDRVEKLDFIDTPRFALDGTENINLGVISSYNPNSATEGSKLGNRRLYVALADSDPSLFGSSVPSDLLFTYDPVSGKFVITSSLTGTDLTNVFTHVVVDNYKPTLTDGENKFLIVNLLGIESSAGVIAFPQSS